MIRLAHVPVVFMRSPVFIRSPRPPMRIRRLRQYRLRVWCGITAGLLVFWYGLAAWVFSL